MITDAEIIYEALRHYTMTRQEFCKFVHEKDSKKKSGEEFTDEEKSQAIQIAKQCDRLLVTAWQKIKKAESPIIRIN